MSTILEGAKREAQERTNGSVMMLGLSGSRLHGVAGPASDVDVRGVFLPRLEDMALGKRTNVVKLSGDAELAPLQEVLRGLERNDPNALTLLFSTEERSSVVLSPKWLELTRRIKEERLLSTDLSRFMGFAKGQAARFSAKGGKLKELAWCIERRTERGQT